MRFQEFRKPIDLIKQRRDQETYRSRLDTLQSIAKDKHTPQDQELKDKLMKRFDTLKTTKESWSKKYKKSINCSNPKGFSQKAHCAGRTARQKGRKTKSKSVK